MDLIRIQNDYILARDVQAISVDDKCDLRIVFRRGKLGIAAYTFKTRGEALIAAEQAAKVIESMGSPVPAPPWEA